MKQKTGEKEGKRRLEATVKRETKYGYVKVKHCVMHTLKSKALFKELSRTATT